jgi:hypothetical protein
VTEREGVKLFVGGDAVTVQRRRCHLAGPRMFSAAYGPKSRFPADVAPQVVPRLDSGAFSDAPKDRLTPEAALERQLAWERNAARFWGAEVTAEALVSYDLLIDEKWTAGGRRVKQRWSVGEADRAVRVTVEAAAYLTSQRERLAPRRLILAVQGVDHFQYEDCVAGVLAHATPADVLGLGGWCILGQWRSWLPTFWGAMRRSLPLAAAAGVRDVHIFGVLYRPALGPLLWLCDQHSLSLSTDSSAPVLAPCFPDQSRSATLAPTWEENCRLWTEALAGLRRSAYYREPPAGVTARQLTLF